MRLDARDHGRYRRTEEDVLFAFVCYGRQPRGRSGHGRAATVPAICDDGRPRGARDSLGLQRLRRSGCDALFASILGNGCRQQGSLGFGCTAGAPALRGGGRRCEIRGGKRRGTRHR
jgi:hypothetical protein